MTMMYGAVGPIGATGATGSDGPFNILEDHVTATVPLVQGGFKLVAEEGGWAQIYAGTGDTQGGDCYFTAGDHDPGTGMLVAGAGNIRLHGGSTNGGDVDIIAGQGVSQNAGGGSVVLGAANKSGSGLPGNIKLILADQGNFIISGVPTSDPGVAGAVWSSSGTLKISSGP